MQSYSKNDLVRFLYHETSAAENHDIAYQLEDCGDYNSCFQDLLESKRLLDSLNLSPSKANVNQILRASRRADLMSA